MRLQRKNFSEIEFVHLSFPGSFGALRSDYTKLREDALPHRHDFNQVLHIAVGSAQIQTEDGTWICPSNRAIWIPERCAHTVTFSKEVSVNNLYFSKKSSSQISARECFPFVVSPLFKELFNYAITVDYKKSLRVDDFRVFQVMLDQIMKQKHHCALSLHLPAPVDPRLKKLASLIMKNISGDQGFAELCKSSGISLRNAQRLFRKETGLTLQSWFGQQRLMRSGRPSDTETGETDISEMWELWQSMGGQKMKVKRIQIKSKKQFESELMDVARRWDSKKGSSGAIRGEYFESLEAIRKILTD